MSVITANKRVNSVDVVPVTINDFLESRRNKSLLRFITCGSVDDGKSTLIGRLLWNSHQLFDDQLATLEIESRKYGTQGQDIDFALLFDGLSAEREQGITIDVAYRFFATEKRQFIVADTPGHEQYTRNMVTGASTADVAVILVNASLELLPQTHRHAYLVSLMGIKHVVLAVNKMDLVQYDEAVFAKIEADFRKFAENLGYVNIVAIPVSALKGDNITQRSSRTPWFQGPTLISYLEAAPVAESNVSFAAPFVFPVQWVNRPNAGFRGFAGTIASGQVKVGDEIRITASGQTAKVKRIVTMDGDLASAYAGQSVTLTLSREVDVSRGDVLSLASLPLEMTDQFEAVIVWMNKERGHIGRSYDIKIGPQWSSASITSIRHRVDITTLAHESSRELSLNDISVCHIAIDKPLTFEAYENTRTLGGFILVDRFTYATVAAGMIRHTLRRSQNVHKQVLSITRESREKLNGHIGQVVWFTGLSGSGKSTIANALEMQLHRQGYRTYILDGDNIRQGINKDLGFTDADRVENIRRIAEIAKLMMDAGLIVITAFISPFAHEREMAMDLIGRENYLEVYVSTPLEVCEKRDVKGLYKKARTGEIPNMTGINSPYEAPTNCQITLDGSKGKPEDHAKKVLSVLQGRK